MRHVHVHVQDEERGVHYTCCGCGSTYCGSTYCGSTYYGSTYCGSTYCGFTYCGASWKKLYEYISLVSKGTQPIMRAISDRWP